MQAKTILIAVTGSIAAYKSCELVRSLTKQGLAVTVLMTENATRFVGPLTFETLTGEKIKGLQNGGFAVPVLPITTTMSRFSVDREKVNWSVSS